MAGLANALHAVSGRSVKHVSVRRVRSVIAATCFAMLLLVSSGTTAYAATNEVLILGETVTGGTSSLEAQQVSAKGFTPVVVDNATWEGMTTAEFASYRAIIIGDPTCGSYHDTSHLTAALSNPTTWGAAVNGNVVIIGTDPVFHAGGTLTSGPGRLVSHGVDFALAQDGKTGAYIDLSCAYGEMPPNTPVALLDGIRSGGFSVDGGPSTVCFNEAHIVATHPALTGLTDADLSNWSCSVHEAFDTWPPDYTVLAIAKNFGSTFTASDGTVGEPYILASGSGLHSYPLSLSPSTQTVGTGSSASVTAQLLDTATGLPAIGQTISFRVASGPNAGTSGSCVPNSCATDANGQVAWRYAGSNAGTDTVQSWLDQNGDHVPSPGEPQTSAGVTWTAPPVRIAVLGDSFASGEGTYNKDSSLLPRDYYGGEEGGSSYPQTVVSGFNPDSASRQDRCHRSPFAAGPLVGAAEPDFVACSGAKIANVGLTGQYGEPPQVNMNILSPSDSEVLLSVSGDDLNFPDVLKACIDVSGAQGLFGSNPATDKTCKDKIDAELGHPPELRRLTTVMKSLRHQLLDPIGTKTHGATIFLLGYPHLFPDGGNDHCGNGLTAQRQRYLNDATDTLDGALKNLADHYSGNSRVKFVDTSGVFQGHAVCDSRPYFNDLQFRGGIGPFGPNNCPVDYAVNPDGGIDQHICTQSFHPNSWGYIAEALMLTKVIHVPPNPPVFALVHALCDNPFPSGYCAGLPR